MEVIARTGGDEPGPGVHVIGDMWANFEPGGDDVMNNEWSRKRDEILKGELYKIREQKKKRQMEHEEEVGQLLTRKLPFEYLARDWFDEQKVSANT